MNKLLREVPSMESWIAGSNNSFVPVTLGKDFIADHLSLLRSYIEQWLEEPRTFADAISKTSYNSIHPLIGNRQRSSFDWSIQAGLPFGLLTTKF